MTKKASAVDLMFPRSFKFSKGKHVVSGAMQPYCVGMYVCINDSKVYGPIQLNLPHKAVKKWIDRIEKKFKKDKYKIKIVKSKISDFLSVEEIENYILK